MSPHRPTRGQSTSLAEAVSALRHTSGHSHDAERTRARIVGTVRHKKRQRQQVTALLLLSFVGLPLGTTAYAAFFGTPRLVQQVMDRVFHLAPAAATRPHADTHRHARAAALAASVPIPSATTATAPSAPVPHQDAHPAPASTQAQPAREASPQETTTRTTRSPARTRAPRPVGLGETQSPASDRSAVLYERAHHLHFVARDPTAALDAWNTYLAQAQRPALRPEALYNRALCLARLQRKAEAIEALTPFAQGQFGGYRRRDATALIGALSD